MHDHPHLAQANPQRMVILIEPSRVAGVTGPCYQAYIIKHLARLKSFCMLHHQEDHGAPSNLISEAFSLKLYA